ncbi:hypothetical protein PoB_007387900 [Plakobranchus ocellatus]|uniref:Uncharacterized protein n=1 Tax=Plakobranchus ocellatus TaxID=259542 RepID=A0AAV4DT77_9GAST|nr:hypothetical protein PoB_007387900 [Plakobranchus ocellatus]
MLIRWTECNRKRIHEEKCFRANRRLNHSNCDTQFFTPAITSQRRLQYGAILKVAKFRPNLRAAYQACLIFETAASESPLKSAGALLSRVRAPPPAPWPDGGLESLRSPCCGLAIH